MTNLLIAVEDLTDYGVSIASDEMVLVGRLIAAASQAVIQAAGSPILQTTSTVTLVAAGGTMLRLPGLPIVSAQSVTIGGVNILGADADGSIEPGNCVLNSAGIYRPTGWANYGPEIVEITYTHGYQTVPMDVVDLVVSMVIAGLSAARSGDDGLAMNNGRMSSVSIDDYKEAYATGDVEAVTPMMLPKRTRDWLASRFGGGTQVVTAL